MKRVFAHIGFSFALTMLLANLIKAEYVLYVMAGLAILLVASLLIKKYRQALAVPVCLGAAVFACLIFSLTYNSVVLPEQTLNNKTAECEFYITDLPQKSEDGTYSYTIKTKEIRLRGAPQNMKLKMKTSEPVNANSHQLIRGKLRFYKIGSSAFASNGYWGKDIFLSSTLNEYKLTGETVKSPMRFIVNARKGIKSRLSRIPGDEGALSRALIIGDKSDISLKLYNDFKFAGAAHLMAVSGLHLTAICGFILYLLKKLRIKNKASYMIIIAVIAYYCALCGFSKSVVRSGIMMTVLMLGNIIGKHGDALNSLGLATFIICINPFAVCDAGAVMSVICVLSLCTAYPHLYKLIKSKRFSKNPHINRVAVYVLTKLAGAFCIFCYSLCAAFLFFGSASVMGIVSSLILIPLGSFATILALITDIAIRIKIGLPFILLSRLVNRLIIIIVGWFASFRFSVINFENYFGFVLAGILIIFAICFIINKKLIKKAVIISVIIVTASLISMSANNSSSSYAYITSDGAMAICSKGNAVVFGVESKSDYYAIKHFLVSRRQTIDCLITDYDNEYSNRLCNSFECKSKELHSFDKSFSDDLSVSYSVRGSAYTFTADICGKTITESNFVYPKSGIRVINNFCIDDNGVIDLANGDIIYRISDKNYNVRRVSIWQE